MTSFLYETPEGQSNVSYELSESELTVGGKAYPCDGHHVWLQGRRVPFWTQQSGDIISVWLDGEVFTFTHKDPRQRREQASAATSSGLVCAQMPGKILNLAVKPGDRVSQGQNLLVMESMKMELSLDAPLDGTVEAVEVSAGQMVALGERLVLITPAQSQVLSS